MNIKQYKITQRIGGGRFGDVFQCQNTETNQNYAIKLELKNTKHQQLIHEAQIYEYLQSNKVVDQTGQQLIQPAIPKLYAFGQEGDYNFLIMELLGHSLENLFVQCNKKFSLKTVLYLADQLIYLLEYIHSRGVIHLNLKPSDIMVGVQENAHKLYLIDFGLAKKSILNEDNKKHQFQKIFNEKLIRVTQFSSINIHLGKDQGKRDDLESLGYILIYFLRGSLPWMGSKINKVKSSYQQIVNEKIQITIETLCQDLPIEFQLYFEYIKNLEINVDPDYGHLRQLFYDLYQKMDFTQNNILDWQNLQIIQENL